MVFRVGQRVRVARPDPKNTHNRNVRGREGVVVEVMDRSDPTEAWDYAVELSGTRHNASEEFASGVWGFDACELEPLTDPKADAFLERIKNIKPYEEPIAPKVRPTITMHWTPLPPHRKTYIDDNYIVRFGERPPREKTFSEHFADVWHSLTGR